MAITHAYTSTKADPSDSSIIGKTKWNDNHLQTGVYDVMAYGAVGDGTTDDFDAIQAAITACGLTGGTIFFPPGKTYYLNKTGGVSLKLPPANTQWMVFSGYGATIKLSVNVYSFLEFDHTGTVIGDAFEWFAVEGFQIDANTAVAGYPMVISSYQDWRIDIRHIRVRDVRVFNVSAAGKSNTGIWLNPKRGSAEGLSESEPVPNYVTDIEVSNYRQEGGAGAVVIAGSVYGADTQPRDVRIEIDDIRIRDIWWDSGMTGVDRVSTTGIHIGSYAKVGTVHIDGAYLKGSGDNLIEVNSARSVLVENVYALDATAGAFYMKNFTQPLGFDEGDDIDEIRQEYIWRNCVYDTTEGGTGGLLHFGETANIFPIGHITMENCCAYDLAADNGGNYLLACDALATVESITMRDCRFHRENYVSAGTETPNCIILGTVGRANGDATPILLDNVHVYSHGTRTGSDNVNYLGVLFQAKSKVHMKDCEIDLDLVDGASYKTKCVDLYNINGTTCDLTMDNCTLRTGTGSYPLGVALGDSPRLTIPNGITLRNCDFSDAGTRPYTSIDSNGNASTAGHNMMKLRAINCIYATTPAPAAVTTKVTLNIDAVSTSTTEPEITTAAAHGLVKGDWVHIDGITELAAGYYQVSGTPASTVLFKVLGTTTGTDTGTCQPCYINRDGYDEDFIVTGGTVTAIALSTDSGTTFTDTGVTAGSFRLRGGDIIHITNSSAPTTTKIPRP